MNFCKNKTQEILLSDKIKVFLEFINQSRKDYKFVTDQVPQYDKETQDILHAIELNDLSYKERAKLATKLKIIRQHRRKEKIALQNLQPLADFLETKQAIDFINKLQIILGEVRKSERYTFNPAVKEYRPKTDILTRPLSSNQKLELLIERYKKAQ